jgi:hypothetical protein
VSYRYPRTPSDYSGLLFAVCLVLGLIGYIYLLATGEVGSPYSCPPGHKEVSGWSGGRYTHLCVQP